MPKRHIKSNKTWKKVIISSKHNNSKKYFKFNTSFSSLLANSHFLSLAKILSLLSHLNYCAFLWIPTRNHSNPSLFQVFSPFSIIQVIILSFFLQANKMNNPPPFTAIAGHFLRERDNDFALFAKKPYSVSMKYIRLLNYIVRPFKILIELKF